MADLTAQVANFTAIGEKASTHLIADGKAWVRNHIPFHLSGWKVDLYQLPVVFERQNKLRGEWTHTTTIYVRDVAPLEQPEAERLVTDLCHLLSFASMSEVRPFSFGLGNGWHRWNGEGIVSDWRPPIERDGKAIAKFVHRTWARYRKMKRSRKLPELIHYLTLTDRAEQPIEVRMLLTFIALENMKATWASSTKIPRRHGQFLKSVTRAGKAKKVPYRFEELLHLMFAAVTMRPSLTRIVRVRNQIVHLGLTSRSLKGNLDYYERTKALQHEYVLRLLGYSGAYVDYRTLSLRTLKDFT